MAMAEQAPKLKTTERRGRVAVEEKSKALERLVVEYVDVDSVKPNSYNPNRQDSGDFALLLRSMREDGFTQPIVAQRGTSEIVDGEHRWRAAREIGLAQVPVVFVDMTPEQMRIATLRHNRARGSEDIELSSQVLRDLRALGALEWAQDSLMIDDDELEKLLDDVGAPEDLASDEYSQAWVPSKNVDHIDSEDRRDGAATSFTPAAKELQAVYDKRLQGAGSEEERVRIEFDMRRETYRLVLSFTDADADLVRAVLEPKPAQKVLELCRARSGGGK